MEALARCSCIASTSEQQLEDNVSVLREHFMPHSIAALAAGAPRALCLPLREWHDFLGPGGYELSVEQIWQLLRCAIAGGNELLLTLH